MNKIHTGQTKTIKNYWLKSKKRAKRDFRVEVFHMKIKKQKRNETNERNLKKKKSVRNSIVTCVRTKCWVFILWMLRLATQTSVFFNAYAGLWNKKKTSHFLLQCQKFCSYHVYFLIVSFRFLFHCITVLMCVFLCHFLNSASSVNNYYI